MAERLEEGKRFFARRNKGASVTYVAYFQNGSNTHGAVGEILPRFREALQVSGVQGVVVATRPDCLGEEWLDALTRLAEETFLLVELGVESVYDQVLSRAGRGHNVESARSSVRRLKGLGIPVCAHLIFGLPGEPADAYAVTARIMNDWGVDVVKLHQRFRGRKGNGIPAGNPGSYRNSAFTYWQACHVDAAGTFGSGHTLVLHRQNQ